MAPFQGPSQEELIALLKKTSPQRFQPVTLGRYAPQAVVEFSNGLWTLSPLTINQEKAKAAGKAALKRGESWMPEMEWQFLEKGEPQIAASATSEFIAEIEAMAWTYT